MISPKDILVTTASRFDGFMTLGHFRPVSSHIVAGTNFFSDFLASFSDVFGGRSQTYRSQLTSLYNDAIEQLKVAAWELGANAIVGLHVDLDEISGKGKSMFMVTATGTAVLLDTGPRKVNRTLDEKLENVSIERIRELRHRKELVDQANSDSLVLDVENWGFITDNQVYEVFDFVIRRLEASMAKAKDDPSNLSKFYHQTLAYIGSLPLERQVSLLYGKLGELAEGQLLEKIFDLIRDLYLLEFSEVESLLGSDNFEIQKRGLRVLTFDKKFYNRDDVTALKGFSDSIQTLFPERYTRTFKKQLLSSKEKEVWTCDCNSSVEVGKICGNCKHDIYGFRASEVQPPVTISKIEEKIGLIVFCLA